MVKLIVIASAAAMLLSFADATHTSPNVWHLPSQIDRIFNSIAWSVHFDQIRRGVTTFQWFWLPALAASTWTFSIVFGLQEL